ncbi:MAG TPA: caspase family protein [Candidatus Omnitrophica bacterium]|nr:caspase family protein [Candidatus Omnitrophota bacterium]
MGSVDYAFHDANIMKEYFKKVFGIPEKNICVIKNAKKSDFEMWFGTEREHRGRLYNLIRPGLKPSIYIYYVGHGAPDVERRNPYFVPVDAHPNYVRLNGYSVDLFYRNLSKLEAKEINVIIDACFSGGSQKGMLIAQASPLGVELIKNVKILSDDRLTIITATDKDEIASWYPEKGHSLFTYYFLKALKGEADMNKDKILTLRELEKYLSSEVPYMAGRLYNRKQNPVIKGDLSKVFVRWR